MNDKRKSDSDSKRIEPRETRQTIINLVRMCADKSGKAAKADVYREARRRGIVPTDTEEALQLLRESDAIMETSDGSLLLTYQ